MLKRTLNLVGKLGYVATAGLALATTVVAFFSVKWTLAILGIALVALSATLFANNRRQMIYLSSMSKRLRLATSEIGSESASGSLSGENLARELHLRTLEELRVLRAEIARTASASEKR